LININKKILRKIDVIIKKDNKDIHITGFVINEKYSKDKIPRNLNWFLYGEYKGYLIYLCNIINTDMEIVGYPYRRGERH
jgi:hypothetical protein